MSPIIGFATNLTKHPDLPNMFKYTWLEGVTEAKITYLNEVTDWNMLDKWPMGRLFGELGEYHWQRNADNTIHAVIILDEGDLPDKFENRLEIEKNKRSPMILWGEWIDPSKDLKGNPDGVSAFYTRDIPKTQTYPIPPDQAREAGKTPRLVVQRYHHNDKGDFIRCVSLEMLCEEETE